MGKITPKPGHQTPRVLADRKTAVISRFTYTVQGPRDRPEFELDMDVAIDDWGRPTCKALAIRPLDDAPITGESLRRVPVATILREATGEAASWFEYHGPTEGGGHKFGPPAVERRLETYKKFAERGRRPRKGSPLTSEFLSDVAEVYGQALEEGYPPTQTVADTWHVQRSAASRWVRAARDRKLLGDAAPGRATA